MGKVSKLLQIFTGGNAKIISIHHQCISGEFAKIYHRLNTSQYLACVCCILLEIHDHLVPDDIRMDIKSRIQLIFFWQSL
jgi:hypothetical protein